MAILRLFFRNGKVFFRLDANYRTRFVFKTGGHQNIADPYYKRIIWFFKNGY